MRKKRKSSLKKGCPWGTKKMDFYCKYPEYEVLAQRLTTIPKFWDGKKSILELKENNFQWRQIEWIGFWFEYWCKNNLSDIMEIPYHNKIKNVTFDAFWKFPWDFKTHAINNGRYVIVNACSAIDQAISEFGYFGLVIVKGIAKYDNEERNFRNWHRDLKGGKTPYVQKREQRGGYSRTRKTSFEIKEIIGRRFDAESISRLHRFQKGFREPNGSARKEKFMIDPKDIDSEIIFHIKIGN